MQESKVVETMTVVTVKTDNRNILMIESIHLLFNNLYF